MHRSIIDLMISRNTAFCLSVVIQRNYICTNDNKKNHPLRPLSIEFGMRHKIPSLTFRGRTFITYNTIPRKKICFTTRDTNNRTFYKLSHTITEYVIHTVDFA